MLAPLRQMMYRSQRGQQEARTEMLRDQFSAALKEAMKSKDQPAVSTVRLIMAAIKDRDIAARGDGNSDGIPDDEVMRVLQTMIKQRRESITLYQKGGREDLASQEAAEIDIIERFLPEQMDEAEIEQTVEKLIGETGASSLKDMGPSMALLRERYAGRMDFGKASAVLKKRLCGN